MSRTYLVIFCLLATSLAGCLSEDTDLLRTHVIPYEPGSATLIQSKWSLIEHNVYFQQFTAPSTGEYTGMTIITVPFGPTYGWGGIYYSCSAEYSGVLGAALYAHNATEFYGPGELIAQGTVSFDNVSAVNTHLRHTIQFDDSAHLTANTIYWVAIASDSPTPCRLESGYYGGYYAVETDDFGPQKGDFIPPSNDYGLVRYMHSSGYDDQVTGFSASEGFPTSSGSNSWGEYTYWYRIF